jgi:hypothetical protein
LERRSPAANGYVSEVMTDKKGIYIKSYAIDYLKGSGIINMGIKTVWNIMFSSDCENNFHIWFWILM